MRALLGLTLSLLLVQTAPPSTPRPAALTRAEMAIFLQEAKVLKEKELGKGSTVPLRLTLTDGHVTHDAVFQSIDEHKALMEFAGGRREVNFVDSWRYNVASFQIAELLGIGDMMPVTVERKYNGKSGSLSWWIDTLMDERERVTRKKEAPNPVAWNEQMQRLRVFTQLVDDTDRNLGNVLITPQWKLIMIDFTRAFRLQPVIKQEEITRCDRHLLDALDHLELDTLTKTTVGFLTPAEAKAVIARRDLIVAYVRKLIAEKGEAAVLY
jgi:hypothetical protein